MLNPSIDSKRQRIKTALLALLLCFSYSCSHEDDTCGCCGTTTTLLQVRMIDPSTDVDITSSGEVDVVDLFIFKPDGGYFNHVSVSMDSLINYLPITLKVPNTESYWISAWGNLNGNQIISKIVAGCLMDTLSVLLKTTPDGYASCPDDLFFGLKQFDRHPAKNRVRWEEILISRNNARMTITVRGLPQGSDASDYYFTICNGSNGYDFRGNPLSSVMDMKQNGIFQPNTNDFVTPGAFNIIHTNNNQYLTINLYKKTSSGLEATNALTDTGTIIASVSKDSNGELISPQAGKTANVLIDLTQGETPVVTLIVTPWNELYNWMVW